MTFTICTRLLLNELHGTKSATHHTLVLSQWSEQITKIRYNKCKQKTAAQRDCEEPASLVASRPHCLVFYVLHCHQVDLSPVYACSLQLHHFNSKSGKISSNLILPSGGQVSWLVLVIKLLVTLPWSAIGSPYTGQSIISNCSDIPIFQA
jgi:hypothetical protein